MIATTPRRPDERATAEAGGEARVLLRGVGRELFEAIVAARGDRPVPRLTWLDEELELMSPSYLHEILARRLGAFVAIVASALGIDHIDAGSTTWKRGDLGPGKEPDACFYLAHEPVVRGLCAIDQGIHPPPDLVIEVELSNPLLDAGRVYSALGVPELWRCDGRTLRFFHLRPDGRYGEREHSLGLPPLRSAEAMDWIGRADAMGARAWKAAVERWAREELLGRAGEPPADPRGD